MDQGGSVDIPGSWHSRASNCYRFGSSGRGQWSTSNPGHNEPTYKDYWEIPGGAVEADESPYAAVVRELKEELGLRVQPRRLLVTDWVPPRPGRTEGLIMVFDGGVLTPEQTAQIRLPAEELRSWAWCTEQEAGERLSELLARRIVLAGGPAAAASTFEPDPGVPGPPPMTGRVTAVTVPTTDRRHDDGAGATVPAPPTLSPAGDPAGQVTGLKSCGYGCSTEQDAPQARSTLPVSSAPAVPSSPLRT